MEGGAIPQLFFLHPANATTDSGLEVGPPDAFRYPSKLQVCSASQLMRLVNSKSDEMDSWFPN
jgi:hypothetical protein